MLPLSASPQIEEKANNFLQHQQTYKQNVKYGRTLKLNIGFDFMERIPSQFDQIQIGYCVVQTPPNEPVPPGKLKWLSPIKRALQYETHLLKNVEFQINSKHQDKHLYIEIICSKENEQNKHKSIKFFTVHRVFTEKILEHELKLIPESEIIKAQQLWGDGIVTMGQLMDNKKKLKKFTEDFLDQLYAFDLAGRVLFKPTKAADIKFRLTKESALSYFIGGDSNYPEDSGFALTPWTHIEFENSALVRDEDRALAMGNYLFTDVLGNVTRVDFTFGYILDDEGHVKINLHHSSLPFERCKSVYESNSFQVQKEINEQINHAFKNLNQKSVKILQIHQGKFALPFYEMKEISNIFFQKTYYSSKMMLFIEVADNTEVYKDIKKKPGHIFNELEYICQKIHLNHSPTKEKDYTSELKDDMTMAPSIMAQTLTNQVNSSFSSISSALKTVDYFKQQQKFLQNRTQIWQQQLKNEGFSAFYPLSSLNFKQKINFSINSEKNSFKTYNRFLQFIKKAKKL